MATIIEASAPAVTSDSQNTEEHWNNWPNAKGFDPEYEERTPVELSVTGRIPAYAAGTLYRTGPGKSHVETEGGQTFQVSHWFDGFSQTHRFQILDSGESEPPRVLYNSRYSTDELIEHVRKTGSLGGLSFGQKRDPCKTVFNKVQSDYIPPSGPSFKNIGVTLSVNMPGLDVQPDGQSTERWGTSQGIRTLYAKTDYSGFKKLDPETLEPIGLATQESLHPDLIGRLAASHPRSDPRTGDMFNFNLELGSTCTYRVFGVSASTGKTTILATFPGIPAYLHSLLITEDYVLLCVWNSHVNPIALADQSFMDAILPTDPSKPATWYVVDRKHGKGLVATYESPAFFCFHTINSWQEPSKEDPTKTDIVADLVRMDNTEFISSLLYDNIVSSRSSAKEFAAKRGDALCSTITRFRLPGLPSSPNSDILKATVEWSACKSFSPELPTMNPKIVTQKHRYVYSTTFRGEATLTDGILKFDCETQETRLWAHHGHSPGEAIFVANPDGIDEDDGVLLSVVLDGLAGNSYLLCLDARDLSELGRANVKRAVAFGFHGQHVPFVGMPTGDY
ncbi:Carotenoid oxygenase [Penicillium canariense]|uniref:Carotenoid oxygenase n=1 Tax=Penicillium canariense TaxID=189055 RepID=A0A9W9LPZ2_9EURO|nr:Carotenoid oxygenase [Penicillium canariense]KAJ5168716.1 Carotenoid oxygenase [Penicillium canariense]